MHPGSSSEPEKLILELAKRIKENGDLLRNAIGQSWADTALDEMRTDATEIQKLVEKLIESKATK
jgi:hypothetical protein